MHHQNKTTDLLSVYAVIILILLSGNWFKPIAANTCVDDVAQKSDCAESAARGDCDIDTTYTPVHCQKSCAESCRCPRYVVGGQAQDNNDCNCVHYIQDGKLENGESWINGYCPSSVYRRQNMPCPDPPAIPFTNYTTTYGNKWLSEVTYECLPFAETNLTANDNGRRICLRNQTWLLLKDHGEISCYLKTCKDAPDTIGNATWSVNKPINERGCEHGTVLTYTCILGHELISGEVTRKCEANSTTVLWTDWAPPVCKMKDCGRAPSIAHGTVEFNKTTYDEIATHTCDEGFYFENQNGTKRCDENGKWSPDLVCLGVDCGKPMSVEFAMFSSPSTRHPAVITYTCQNGYKLENGTSNKITCTTNGRWEGAKPVCEVIPAADNSDNNYAIYIGIGVGAVVIVAAAAIGTYFCVKRRSTKNQTQNKHRATKSDWVVEYS
ncbi:complement factor H-like [Tubulanus polymorphus]|uniref:complement factor H-like n=1 Tax=Tubulanus polymorphus TaxID=672921 RepID=UPI003DA24482